MKQGEFKKRINALYFDIGKDKESNRIASRRIANVIACLIDEARKEFPMPRSFDEIQTAVRLQHKTVLDFMAEIEDWFRKWFGDDVKEVVE